MPGPRQPSKAPDTAISSSEGIPWRGTGLSIPLNGPTSLTFIAEEVATQGP